MTGMVMVVPPFCLVALLLLLSVVWQLANDGPESHTQPRWVPQPAGNQHPCWAEIPRETLLQRAAEAHRQIALARRELALADHFDWSALTPAIGQRVPIEHLPVRRDLVLT